MISCDAYHDLKTSSARVLFSERYKILKSCVCIGSQHPTETHFSNSLILSIVKFSMRLQCLLKISDGACSNGATSMSFGTERLSAQHIIKLYQSVCCLSVASFDEIKHSDLTNIATKADTPN